ncbi:MAG TPA: hypothetical protein VGK94_00430 [Candidatus Polarisedimenticolia bacterium]|jgi:cobalamin biosynthesis Mg chelatase CobN
MKRKHGFALVFVGVLLMAAFGSLRAQYAPSGSDPQSSDSLPPATLSGEIISVSDSSVVIKTSTGAEVTFAVDDKSSVPPNIAAGDSVKVDFDTPGGSTYHAVSVTAQSDTGSTTGSASDSSQTPPAGDSSDQGANTGTQPEQEAMPHTASPLPIIVLMGVLSLGAAVAMRRLSRGSV